MNVAAFPPIGELKIKLTPGTTDKLITPSNDDVKLTIDDPSTALLFNC